MEPRLSLDGAEIEPRLKIDGYANLLDRSQRPKMGLKLTNTLYHVTH